MSEPDGHAAPLRGVRAIYFDLDDTLCSYWDACKVGLRGTFEALGVDGRSPEEMMHHWAAAFREFAPSLKSSGWYEGYLASGEPTRTEQMRLTLERLGIESESHAKELSQRYFEERDRALRLFPEAREVLETLAPRYRLGLITNGPADIQRQEIATLEIERYFESVFIEGEMGEGKPHPRVMARAQEAAGCPPDQILFVGNSYAHDVRPALEAGWHAVWVRRASDIPPSVQGEAARPEEKPEGAPEPDASIGDLRELLPLLGI